MNKGILYSNGVVSSLSQTFLTNEVLNRMSDCKSLESFIKILEETTFSFSQESETFNEKLQIELNKLTSFVKLESPSDKFTQFFLLPFDYENIQTFCKCQILGLDFEKYVETEGVFTVDEIKNNINNKNYKFFKNPFIEKSLCEFEKISQEKTLSGWEIETIFKKHLYENLLKVSSGTLLNKLINYKITIENISLSSRAKSLFELESQMLNKGYLGKNNLLQIFNKDKNILNLDIDKSIFPFVKLALEDKTYENVVKFERLRQNYISNYFYKIKDSIETFAPFAYYCYRKLNDIKNVRLAYAYIENGLNHEVKKRILNSEK